MSYWVAIPAKNAARHLPRTLSSLLDQTLKPERVVVVDDGSTDQTPEMLRRFERDQAIEVLTRPDKGYDIRRVPANINLAWNNATASGLKCDFFMVSGDDCVFPRTYASALLSKVEADTQIVVASGRPSSSRGLSREHSPSGSGRMIRTEFWRDVGEMYPVKAGWETWLLYAALDRGLKVELFDDIVFEHLRPRGAGHQFIYWGAAMQTLGYHPLYALGRIARNALTPAIGPRGSMNMLCGYLQAKLGSEDAFISPFEPLLRCFVHRQQARKIARFVASRIP